MTLLDSKIAKIFIAAQAETIMCGLLVVIAILPLLARR
jgi:hypothetical protein